MSPSSSHILILHEFLRIDPEPLRASELQACLGLRPDSETLRRMKDAGLLTEYPYRLTPEGRAIAQR